ncbi:T9SS type A sorting domain-containing protein [Aureibacter tunicatorum]|uniref:Secretion system C-terminal sorting domain-containing protein n=1 Tax=Aureibacter tunicatorum TaxID=866807 RepID=A0AAE3XJS5_9BACT|nr:T9SS type A sorting domain-containing protein [Aureibacter tunicatorum]MDR6237389.1 hypothetical protein [Aureibacter tunicatorum]BDD06379.1 hypothetical protein AUTU_38620 [Aureibacter tunicatorum]
MRAFTLAIAFTLLFSFNGISQHNYEWVIPLTSEGGSFVQEIIEDGQGNILAVGNFQGSVDFDPGDGQSLLVAGNIGQLREDLFIAKYSKEGEFIFAKHLISNTFSSLNDVSIDASGNIYVTGRIEPRAGGGSTTGQIDFDPSSQASSTLSTSSHSIGFLAKYDRNGNFIWVRRLIGNSAVDALRIEANNQGDTYISGIFQGRMQPNPAQTSTTLNSRGSYDFFVLKYNTSGEHQWSFSVGSQSRDQLNDMVLQDNGEIILTGYFQNTADFDPRNNFTQNLTSNGGQDIYLAKYSSSGQYIQAFRIGAAGDDVGEALNIDRNGELIVTGRFQNTVDFDPTGGLENHTAPDNRRNAFISKYGTNFNHTWTRSIGGSQLGPFTTSISSDKQNNIFITGGYENTVDFDPSGSTSNLTYRGVIDIYLASYTSQGDFRWVFDLGNSSTEYGLNVLADDKANIFLSGQFSGTLNVNPDRTVPDEIVSGDNGLSSFISSYSQCEEIIENISSSICNGDSILLQGAYQTLAGIYRDTLSNSLGCDSILVTSLTVLPSYSDTITVNKCSGDSIQVGENHYFTSGFYQNQLTSSLGCDSVKNYDVTFLDARTIPLTVYRCAGDSVLLGTHYQSEAGIYTDTVFTTQACNIYQFDLRIGEINDVRQTIEICEGDSSFFGNQFRSIQGTYHDTLTTNLGCDSLLTTTLVVRDTFNIYVNHRINDGDSILLAGEYRFRSGTYVNNLTTTRGCDSLIFNTLEVLPVSHYILNLDICEDDSVLAQGEYRRTSGTYYDTLQLPDLRDSVIMTILNVIPTVVVETQSSLCDGDSMFLGGDFQKVAGTYYDTLSQDNGCKRVVITDLSILQTYNVGLIANINDGDSILLGGAYQKVAGIYNDTLTSAIGCDSIISTTLNVFPVNHVMQDTSICEGDSILLEEAFQKNNGIFYDTLTNIQGGDSIIVTTLSINLIDSIEVSQVINNGDSILIGDNYYNSSGDIFTTYPGSDGCDSVVITNLMVLPVNHTVLNISICDGETYYAEGQLQMNAGTYYDTLSTSLGGDSVIVTNLDVNPTYLMQDSLRIKQGDSILLAGEFQKNSGIFYDTLNSSNGCDSVISTTLNVIPFYKISTSSVICEGDSILLGGNYQFNDGVFYDTLTSIEGADSIIVTQLIVNPTFRSYSDLTICQGDSAFVNGSYYKNNGVIYDTLQTIQLCDSIVITTLVVLPQYLITNNEQICTGDSIFLQNEFQKEAGIYYDTLQSIHGCDSVIQTNLSVGISVRNSAFVEICPGDSILIGGQYIKQPGVYYDTINVDNECRHVLITALTYRQSFNVSESKELCEGDSIVVGNRFVKSQGVYLDTLRSTFGCDSIITTTVRIKAKSLLPFNFSGSLLDTHCLNSGEIDLPENKSGSVSYSGNGVINNAFFPNIAGAGEHYVKYEYQQEGNFCRLADSLLLTVSSCTGLESPEDNLLSVKISPVPVKDILNINLLIKKAGVLEIGMYDLQGKRLLKTKPVEHYSGKATYEFNVANYPSGEYIIKIRLNSSIISRKIIIE